MKRLSKIFQRQKSHAFISIFNHAKNHAKQQNDSNQANTSNNLTSHQTPPIKPNHTTIPKPKNTPPPPDLLQLTIKNQAIINNELALKYKRKIHFL